MKRRFSILMSLIVSLLLIFSMFMAVSAVDADHKAVYPLYAGKTNQVGNVEVWNDQTNLYVEYKLNVAGWEMTETHLSITETSVGIPKTIEGNPIPGHFEFSEYHTPPVTSFLYTIPIADLDIELLNVVIAAHAKVQHWSDMTITPTITWTRSAETDGDDTNGNEVFSTLGYGGSWNYADVMAHFATDPMNAVVWDNGTYNGSVVPGREYASWKYAYGVDGASYVGYSDLRLFRASFNIPVNFVTANASLGVVDYADRIPINDNVYVYVNGSFMFWGGTRANTIGTHNGVAGIQAIGYGGPQTETDGWYIPGTFPSITGLTTGANVVEVFAEENELWGGLGKLALTLSGRMYDKFDSAWAATAPGVTRINTAPKGNWGTYVNYLITICDEPVLLNGSFETPDVPGSWTIYANGTLGVDWNVTGAGLEIQTAATVGLTPDDGAQYAELDSTASLNIFQDINTCDFCKYEVSFAWSPRAGNGIDRLEVFWNGSSIGIFYRNADNQAWTTETIGNLTPDIDGHTRLEFREIGLSNSFGMFLDDVKVAIDD